ncbi:MAG: hypothetical protein FWG70_00205 [Oscillospiraceae bacterium]|nr:hypothetical protein [Oscillospiraceae bacterium]
MNYKCKICGGSMSLKDNIEKVCDSCGRTELPSNEELNKFEEAAKIRAVHVDTESKKQESIAKIDGEKQRTRAYVDGQQERTEAYKDSVATKGKIVERGFMLLQDGNFSGARREFESALRIDPKFAKACVGMACVNYSVRLSQDLAKGAAPLLKNSNFKRALKYADENLRETLEEYVRQQNQKFAKARFKRNCSRIGSAVAFALAITAAVTFYLAHSPYINNVGALFACIPMLLPSIALFLYPKQEGVLAIIKSVIFKTLIVFFGFMICGLIMGPIQGNIQTMYFDPNTYMKFSRVSDLIFSSVILSSILAIIFPYRKIKLEYYL